MANSRYFNKVSSTLTGISANTPKLSYVEISMPVTKRLDNIYVSVAPSIVAPLAFPYNYLIRVWVCTQLGNLDDLSLNPAFVAPVIAGSVADTNGLGNIGDVLFEQIIVASPSAQINFDKPLEVQDSTELIVCASLSMTTGEVLATVGNRHVLLSANGTIEQRSLLGYKQR